jgi:hypothetical protein
MSSKTETIIGALRVLANDIQSQDGVANAAIAEAADRMEELCNELLFYRTLNKNFVEAGRICAQIYIARNIILSNNEVISSLKEIDKALSDNKVLSLMKEIDKLYRDENHN